MNDVAAPIGAKTKITRLTIEMVKNVTAKSNVYSNVTGERGFVLVGFPVDDWNRLVKYIADYERTHASN